MPYLEIKLGPDTLLLRFVGRIDYVFGRLPRADVQLRDMKVSRLHTQCFIDSRGNAFVRDLGSSGGTFINNQRLRRGVVAPLTNGVKFRTGDAKITFYDAEPPVNAIEPPGQSDPRGLIRTNHRERYFEAEATVLAMNKVDPETQSGPAEPPPELNPADFADRPGDVVEKIPESLPEAKPSAKAPSGVVAPPKPAAPGKPPTAQAKPANAPAKPVTHRPSGIVEAPWEKPVPAAQNKDKRVTIPPPTRGGAKPPSQPPMQTAEIDEMGKFHAPQAQSSAPARPAPARPASQKGPSPVQPRQPAPVPFDDDLDATGNTSREPVVPDSGAFRPPPPITGAMPAPVEEDEPKQRVGLPTVRLERPAILERQRQIEQEEAEQAAAVRIPTASVRPDAKPQPVPADEAEPAPQIGVAPANREVVGVSHELGDDVGDEQVVEEDLTDDQIHEYLGGSGPASAGFGEIDFGDKGAPADTPEPDEVRFGSAAQVGLGSDADIDLDDEAPAQEVAPAAPMAEEAPAEEVPAEQNRVEDAVVPATPVEAAPVPEVTTSMLGNTTAVKEEAVEESDETTGAPADVPTYDDHGTPPPPTREGATEDRTFKPRKTRKLMKRRKDTAKITDRSNPTPLPEGAKTGHIPLPAEGVALPGAKTMFIPKPDDAKIGRPSQVEHPTGKPRAIPENRERKTLQDMAEGPGGDTVAMPPALMKQLQDELRKPKAPPPPTIGDNPTVKLTDGDDEDEFVLDEDYAFFTPPPATRKAREAAMKLEESDLINANDFTDESGSLPPDKKAASKEDPDTLVD
jgi:hypothetical protein